MIPITTISKNDMIKSLNDGGARDSIVEQVKKSSLVEDDSIYAGVDAANKYTIVIIENGDNMRAGVAKRATYAAFNDKYRPYVGLNLAFARAFIENRFDEPGSLTLENIELGRVINQLNEQGTRDAIIKKAKNAMTEGGSLIGVDEDNVYTVARIGNQCGISKRVTYYPRKDDYDKRIGNTLAILGAAGLRQNRPQKMSEEFVEYLENSTSLEEEKIADTAQEMVEDTIEQKEQEAEQEQEDNSKVECPECGMMVDKRGLSSHLNSKNCQPGEDKNVTEADKKEAEEVLEEFEDKSGGE